LIWTVDPLTFCLATLILVASLLALGDRGRAVRGAMIVGAVVVYFAISVVFGESLAAATLLSPLSILAGIFAIIFALLGKGQSAGFRLSLLTLVCLAIGFIGFAPQSMGWDTFPSWAGLLHQIAILDLVACCLATTYLGVSTTGSNTDSTAVSTAAVGTEPGPEIGPEIGFERTEVGRVDGKEAAVEDWLQLPKQLATRAAIMFLVVCVALALVVYREERLFGTSGIVAIWAAGSEVLAALVAWRVIHRWLKPGNDANLRRWQLKLGLLVAGVAASLGLLLIPVLVTAAKMVPELSS
jgi:hypothetical protein